MRLCPQKKDFNKEIEYVTQNKQIWYKNCFEQKEFVFLKSFWLETDAPTLGCPLAPPQEQC